MLLYIQEVKVSTYMHLLLTSIIYINAGESVQVMISVSYKTYNCQLKWLAVHGCVSQHKLFYLCPVGNFLSLTMTSFHLYSSQKSIEVVMYQKHNK